MSDCNCSAWGQSCPACSDWPARNPRAGWPAWAQEYFSWGRADHRDGYAYQIAEGLAWGTGAAVWALTDAEGGLVAVFGSHDQASVARAAMELADGGYSTDDYMPSGTERELA